MSVLEWRNKRGIYHPKNACKGWKFYAEVSKSEGEEFLRNKAPNNSLFDFRLTDYEKENEKEKHREQRPKKQEPDPTLDAKNKEAAKVSAYREM